MVSIDFDLKSLIYDEILQKLPEYPTDFLGNQKCPRAPIKKLELSLSEKKLAIKNMLRYIPIIHHNKMAKEFASELTTYGHIYAFRYMPPYFLKAPSISDIPVENKEAASIILMILNNLDPDVAQFPKELVTYGGNGQVFSNWIQFRLTIKYLSAMSEVQTLSLYSGHPMGVFPSHEKAPRVVITNGMMIPNYSTKELYQKYFALGVTQYGQMTAGSFCYIGPQGIVHGTTITVLNAGRRYLGSHDLSGKVFVTAGLGGMSGAQAKAAVICGCVGVIAEINPYALKKRHAQGWLDIYSDDLDTIVKYIKQYRANKKAISIGYLGNVVDLWERLSEEKEHLVDLGSDQTSCHNPFYGGYYPVGYTVDEADKIMTEDNGQFQQLVKQSLVRHITAVKKLTDRGMSFWDYGNALLVECHRAGADVVKAGCDDGKTFIFPSYMQDIMGDIFSMGFGPFRWVCTSGLESDLEKTDQIAKKVLTKIMDEGKLPQNVYQQYEDNIQWITNAGEHKLVVGSQARILYADQEGRTALAIAFNKAISSGEIRAPVVLSRDHHDVSGTDSPFRETSNITDGSAFTADMAVQNVIGDAMRGASWVSIHNGGGVGWGDVINGGFGLVLDGSTTCEDRAKLMLFWDVSNGVARRSWSGNCNARDTIIRTMENHPNLTVTVPNVVDDETILDNLFD
uniref:Urocanate hydratase n=1 Tax=Rhabditophanes sp. KR3021 TaxID=114890 RepID=A0AC35U4S1_9BILA